MKKEITILGAGLVGSLLALLLSRKGFQVAVFEKRADPRTARIDEGRSINLALSHRGIRTLKMAEAFDQIAEHLIPMKGRMMHDLEGDLSFQPYGRAGEYINSVSRSRLNKELITLAESAGTVFHFGHKCMAIDPETTSATFEHGDQTNLMQSALLIGADGANSVLRKSLQQRGHCAYEEHYIEHGYKELTIEPKRNDFALEPNYLHIWPRGNYMLIALPNPDKTFTCTLFFPLKGDPSFESLSSESKIQEFFEGNFSDILPLIPDYLKQFRHNPTSNLVTVKAYPWSYKNTLLIGDASHAIVPFYGQGMNAGFEDCRLFMEWGEKLRFDWEKLLPYFSKNRKKDADAIARLALNNFVEMRDKVADQRFLNIKKLERKLQDAYPDIWQPLYTMVTFSDLPYHQALVVGQLQEKVLKELPEDFDPDKVELAPIIRAFQKQKALQKI